MIGKFFYIPKAKHFKIIPRYYDPDEEERQERERRIKDELGIVEEKKEDGKPYRPNIKGQFRKTGGWKAKSSAEGRRASNTRLIILIMILALIAYLFFFSDFNFF